MCEWVGGSVRVKAVSPLRLWQESSGTHYYTMLLECGTACSRPWSRGTLGVCRAGCRNVGVWIHMGKDWNVQGVCLNCCVPVCPASALCVADSAACVW